MTLQNAKTYFATVLLFMSCHFNRLHTSIMKTAVLEK